MQNAYHDVFFSSVYNRWKEEICRQRSYKLAGGGFKKGAYGEEITLGSTMSLM